MTRTCTDCKHLEQNEHVEHDSWTPHLARYTFCGQGYWHRMTSKKTEDYLRLAEHCADYERKEDE